MDYKTTNSLPTDSYIVQELMETSQCLDKWDHTFLTQHHDYQNDKKMQNHCYGPLKAI